MKEVASFPIHAVHISEKRDAFLGLVLSVVIFVLAQLGCAMGKLTLFIIGTVALL